MDFNFNSPDGLPNQTVGDAYLKYEFADTWDIETGDNVVLQGLKNAHAGAAAAYKFIHTQHDRFTKDGTHTPLANLQRSAASARKRQQEHQRNARNAVEAAERNLLAIDQELDKYIIPPTTTMAETAMAGEVRAHVRALPTHEAREAFVQTALQARDYATVRAVLGAPHYLSGTISLTQARWRQDYLTAVAPAMATTRQSLVDGIKLASGAVGALDRHTRQLIDFKKADDLDALAKELEAAP